MQTSFHTSFYWVLFFLLAHTLPHFVLSELSIKQDLCGSVRIVLRPKNPSFRVSWTKLTVTVI